MIQSTAHDAVPGPRRRIPMCLAQTGRAAPKDGEYIMHIDSLCIYRVYKLIKFIKNLYMFFLSYSICI
jgi:hypothetical protein